MFQVKEVEHGDEKDIDFFGNGLIAFVDWTGKFLNNDNSIQKFHLYISTYPGGMYTLLWTSRTLLLIRKIDV